MYLGFIEHTEPGCIISRERWIELIVVADLLSSQQGLPGINPFTREEMIYRPRPDIAIVRRGAEQVGSLDWAPDESGVLVVHGEEMEIEYVISVSRWVAQELGGEFQSESKN